MYKYNLTQMHAHAWLFTQSCASVRGHKLFIVHSNIYLAIIAKTKEAYGCLQVMFKREEMTRPKQKEKKNATIKQ